MANELESASFYPNVTQLKARPGPGVTKYSITESDMKLRKWYKGNSDADDSDADADTIAATGGEAGRWKTIAYIPTEAAVSAGMLRTTAHTVADLYIDTDDGRDANDGQSEDAPVQTWAHLARLIESNVIDGTGDVPTVTVHVLSDNTTENIELTPRVRNGGTLVILDDRDVSERSIGSYAITSRTNWSDGSRTEVSFTCSGIPTSIAALPSGGGVGYQAVITASATADNVGACTWVAAETSARTALGPGWYQSELDDVIDAAVGDTVTFAQLRRLAVNVTVRVIGHGSVTFKDLELGVSGSQHSVNVADGGATFIRCLMHGFDAGNSIGGIGIGSVYLAGCRTANGCRTRTASALAIFATLHDRTSASALNVGNDSYLLTYGQSLVYGNPLVVDQRGHLDVEGSVSIYGATVGLSANNNSWIEVHAPMWGHNISSVYLSLSRFARVGYAASTLAMVGTTPTSAYSLAGTTNASLTLPAGAGTSTSIEAL